MKTCGYIKIVFMYIEILISYHYIESTNIFLANEKTSHIQIEKHVKLYVSHGRAKYITLKNLLINLKSSANCTVRVLNEGFHDSQVGQITPIIFPCAFQNNTVLYQHFGSLTQSLDVQKLQISLHGDNRVEIILFILYIEILFDKPMSIFGNVNGLSVQELGGLSEPFDKNMLSLNYDKSTQLCTVGVILQSGGPPHYGDIMNTTNAEQGLKKLSARNLMHIPCEDFINGNLRYAHKRSQVSLKNDVISLVAEVSDKNSSFFTIKEFTQVPVRTRRNALNTPPIINDGSDSYSFQVEQLTLKAITADILRASDKETPSTDILFKVITPPGKIQGHLIHTSDPGQSLITFYQKDIEQLKIAFQPPQELSTLQRLQQIQIVAQDNEGAVSPPLNLVVVIKPINSKGPQIVRNIGLAIVEGESKIITTNELSIRDPDNEHDVIIVVEDGLFHGRLEKHGKEVSIFTVSDLNSESIRYVHDDSDTHGDAMRLVASDGENQLSTLFTIAIIPKDDEPPQLVYNTGLTLNEGEMGKIDQFLLSARDVDSDEAKIMFVITEPPKHGRLLKKVSKAPMQNMENAKQTVFEKNIKKFSQVDVILSNVYYQHNNEEEFSDFFRFRLSDESSPPNLSGLKVFMIDIKPIDDLKPKRHPGCPLKLTVVEGEKKEFTRNVLCYTDGDSLDSDLVYHITRPPYFVKPPSKENAGRITLTSNSRKDILRFTQRQINHFKIAYHAPPSELGVNKRYLRFVFNVTDTSGNFVDDQRFLIELTPKNNQKPVAKVNPLIVYEKERRIITTATLRAFDEDNFERDLSYMIKKTPKHGELILDGKKLQVGDIFTPEHVKNDLLQYFQDGTETTKDNIKLVLTDGLHLVPVHMTIEILPSDDKTPQLKILQHSLNVLENGYLLFNDEVMQASDEDSDEGKLTFIIASPLKYGEMMKAGAPIAGFRWVDLRNGRISYHHTGGEIGMQPQRDELNLNLTDLSDDIFIGGNIYSGIKININIIPVDSEPPEITGLLRLVIPETDSILITKEIIAVKDKDTTLEQVVCQITKQPQYGYVQTSAKYLGSEISRSGIAVSNFTASDLINNYITYVQSVYKLQEPTSDKFSMQCNDGNNTSPEVIINIAITPTNDEVPYIYVADSIICVEDHMVVLDLISINPYDGDNPKSELQLAITKKPKYGQLLIQENSLLKPAREFTRKLLEQGGKSVLLYQHDGSETSIDSFEMTAYDGKYDVRQTVNIKIVSIDDETPRLVVNTGLKIERGETKMITSYNLKATDLDSDDSSLKYILMMTPKSGKLQKVISPKITVNIGKGGNFTQADIDNRRIRYTHTDAVPDERDTVILDITDGFNRLTNQVFTIIITPEDNILPSILSRGIRLDENTQAIITTDVLSASDLNTPDEKLQFVVTKTPTKGFIQNLDNPRVPITKFTQLELASNKISYFHDSTDEVKVDSFEFQASDGRNKVFRTFRININEVNNKTPRLFVNNINASPDVGTVLTPFEINVKDDDTNPRHLQIKLHELPKYGQLLFMNTLPVLMFTQEQLDLNQIFYQHYGNESNEDYFTVTVSDGKHASFYVGENKQATKRPVKVQINILHFDQTAPILKTNNGISHFHRSKHSIIFKLSRDVLEAVDVEANDTEITFSIKQQPKHGKIIHASSKKTVSKFTQQDVNEKLIHYDLTDDKSEHFSDTFTFDLYDDKKNILLDQVFEIRWSQTAFVNSTLIINETDQTLKVQMKRSGNLLDVALVEINVLNGTAVSGKDFRISNSLQVHFNPGQAIGVFYLDIIDNNNFEKKKDFVIAVTGSINTIVSDSEHVTVVILDTEDEPLLSMSFDTLSVEESVGSLFVELYRTGDTRNVMKAICYTASGTAQGTEGTTVTSYKDYITKNESERSNIITIYPNETVGSCKVDVIDDSLYESAETFEVHISPFYGGKINKHASKTIISIEEDPKDEPMFLLGQSTYNVDESDKFVEIKVKRHGTDLSVTSYVLFSTKETAPVSAKANSDYSPLVETLIFEPGTAEKIVKIPILDDDGQEKIEGEETFKVLLYTPRNARISQTESMAIVTIDDRITDQPRLFFSKTSFIVSENIGALSITIERHGDIRHETFVRCYTRQLTAIAEQDFLERRNTDQSIVHFLKNERSKECLVHIINDEIYEPTKSFNVYLGSAKNGIVDAVGNNVTVIVLDDDQSIISFSEKIFYVQEPNSHERQRNLNVTLHRTGDVSSPASAMLFTKDETAKSALNYQATVQRLEFPAYIKSISTLITVLYNQDRVFQSAFSIHLLQDGDKTNAIFGVDKAVIFIRDAVQISATTFSLAPIVTSLLDFGTISHRRKQPVQGYPVICITACNPQHPSYNQTQSLCLQEHIDNSLTSYRWQIASSVYGDDVSNDFKTINTRLFFTSPDRITLDSVYFKAGSRIRCIAQPVATDGRKGLESFSEEVTIDSSVGLCLPKRKTELSDETFSVQASYTGTKNLMHPNMVKIKVLIPHFDGLLPILSTKKLASFQYILTPSIMRSTEHTCSNLLKRNEITTKYGFLSNPTSFPVSKRPWQFDEELRGTDTLKFYSNLDLDSCLWTFETYYNMTELVDVCGGKIITDVLTKDAFQSHLIVDVPIYVSYLYHSVYDDDGWLDFNYQSSVRLTVVYETGILSGHGVTLTNKNKLTGILHPTSIVVRRLDGRLQISFRTKPHFRGLFILNGGLKKSDVMILERPELPLLLKLLRTEPTFAEPEQLWQLESKFAARDYSGSYIFNMVPCTVSEDEKFSTHLPCTPRDPVSFLLNLTVQQASEPVEMSFNLNTRFLLLDNRDKWLSEDVKTLPSTDMYFQEGQRIYGRVMVDSDQSLGNAYHISIEKVFVCSGVDGYSPTFDPKNKKYGCIVDSETLTRRFKILDRVNPETSTEIFSDCSFNATLAIDDLHAGQLVKQAGSDGFSLDTTPLFKESIGRIWFLHVIYTLRSKRDKHRSLGRRSVENHLVTSFQDGDHNRKNERVGYNSINDGDLVREINFIDAADRGNNLQMIRLGQTDLESQSRQSKTTNQIRVANQTLICIIVPIILIILVGILTTILVYKRHKTSQDLVIGGSNGGTEI